MGVLRSGPAWLLAWVVLAGACQALVGIEGSPPKKTDAGQPSSGATGGVSGAATGGAGAGGSGGTAGTGGTGGTAGDAAGDVDSGCGSAQPPASPTSGDPGGAIELVVAVKQIQLGDGKIEGVPAWKLLGYDLDKLCTCGDDAGGVCKPFDPSKICDGNEGRDNNVGALLFLLGDTFKIQTMNSDDLSAKIQAGSRTVLIRAQGYNGTPNDPQVTVSWYSADKFEVVDAGAPKWDGSDAWPVLAETLETTSGADGAAQYDLDKPKYQDKFAVVSGGVLVANLPEGMLTVSDDIAFRFSSAFMTARLTQDGTGAWMLEDGVLAGVVAANDALAVLPNVNDPLFGQPLCMDNTFYNGIKTQICGYADMSLLGTPAKPCDHLSIGTGFSAVPAKLGVISVKAPQPSPCAPEFDPINDTCDTID